MILPLLCAGQALFAADGGLSMIEKMVYETGSYKSFYPRFGSGLGENENPFLRFFIDTVYENASCYCGGSGSCTKGCAKLSPPLPEESRIVPCTGEKNPWLSQGLCMRYINGALMRTVSYFSGLICSEDGQKCEGEGPHSICSQSFVFPHGFCGLALVGSEYLDQIPNIGPDDKGGGFVRRECLGWKSHNERLRWISLKNEAGEIEDMPLFVELELTEETLMEDLPHGAMLVGFRESPSGHIEVKTDKTICGGPGGEARQVVGNSCFCSDFCRSMEGPVFSHYTRRPRKVIQWNPRFVEIVNQRWKAHNEIL